MKSPGCRPEQVKALQERKRVNEPAPEASSGAQIEGVEERKTE